MLGLLKRLFTNNSAAAKRPQVPAASAFDELTPALRETDPVRLYYDTMSKIQGQCRVKITMPPPEFLGAKPTS